MKLRLGYLLSVFLVTAGCQRQGKSTADSEGAGSTVEGDHVVDAGCPHMVDGECQHQPAPQEPSSPTGMSKFGKPVGQSPQVSLAKILQSPGDFHEEKVVVDGHVSRACSRKGCWMEIAVDDKADAPRCRVTFENYGFFVPRDSAGSHARLEGTVQVTRVEPAAVEHYESEGAKFTSKGADGSAQEVRLIATGVELERI